MLTAAYEMILHGVEHRDLGAQHFDSLNEARATKRLVKRLIDLGYEVDLKKKAA